jgi:hypothetical protein
MHAILVSAFNATLGWLLKVAVAKVFVFGILFLVTTEFTEAMIGKLGSDNAAAGVQGALDGLPSAALYFVGLLRLDVGLPLIFAAYVTGFAIRRLPIIG